MSVILAALAFAAAQEPENYDIFPGTLAVVGGEVVLTRCSAGRDLYVLRDAKGSHAVADYARHPRPASAQVMGAYAQESGRHVLYVRSFEDVAENTSCHLLDALEDLTKPVAKPVPAEAASLLNRAPSRHANTKLP